MDELLDDLLDDLVQEMGKYQSVKVEYDEQINAVVINGDAIQIFAHMIHINPSYSAFMLNAKAINTINKIQKKLGGLDE